MSLSEKEDAKLGISTSSLGTKKDKGQKKDYNLQFAYSPIQYLGVQCNYYNIAERRNSTLNFRNNFLSNGFLPISGQNEQLIEFAIGGYYNKHAGQELEKKMFGFLDMYIGMG